MGRILGRGMGVVTLAGVGAGVLACASLLGIDEPAFAELDGGVGADDAPAPETMEAGGPQPGDGGDGSTDAKTDGRRCNGLLCPSECLDTICSSCPPGTTNLAPLGVAHADSEYDLVHRFERLNDHKLIPSWVGKGFMSTAAPQDQPEVRIDFAAPIDVTNVTVFGHRDTLDLGVVVEELAIELYVGSTAPDVTHQASSDSKGDLQLQLPGTLRGVTKVRVRLIKAAGPNPAFAEIEVCGPPR